MIRTFSRTLLLLLVVLPGLAFAQDRLALVVGIDRYEQVADLQKATNDARAISDALATVGFDVTALTDVDERSFNRGLDRFIRAVKPGDEVVFFFAGHGVEIDGRNYLLPSDAPSGASEMTIRAESIAADEVLGYIQRAGASVAVMILDACRDNPYAGGGRSVGGARGLSIVAAPKGSFVLLSAASGEVAFEGDDSDPNSIFTRALLPLLQEPGLPLPNLARRLRNDVERLASASGKTQRPAYYDEVSGEFMFVPGATSQPAAPAGDPCSRARADWEYVDGSEDPSLLGTYLREYGNCGLFSRLAEQQLALLDERGQSDPDNMSKVATPPATEGNSNLETSDPLYTAISEAVAAQTTAAYDTCARLADPDIVSFTDLADSDLAAAERACRTALASGLEENSERYFSVATFLGRTLMAGEDYSEAARFNRIAAEGGNSVGMNNLGVMYENGLGLPQDYYEAARWYRSGADAGYALAMNNLGVLYENGLGLPRSDGEAARWYRAGAKAGDPTAMYNLGMMYLGGRGVPQSDSEAVRWYRAGAEAGNPLAMGNLGWMYDNGRGVSQSTSEAARWYRAGAEAGDPSAMSNLGMMYLGGWGVPQSDSEAVRWYRAGAEAGNPLAMGNLGWMYQNGRGVTQSDSEAVRWYRAGAEAGDPSAMYNLGFMYQSGLGVAQNDSEAVRWYRSAADAGDADAMNNLGWMYEQGRGVSQSDAEAVLWYRAAAEAGYALGMHNLGRMYDEGKGVPQSDAEAVRWYRAAAEAGNAPAMKSLGLMYESGRGVTQSDVEAVRWYRAGAEAGDTGAMSTLVFLYQYGQGTPQDLSAAAEHYLSWLQADRAAYSITIADSLRSGTVREIQRTLKTEGLYDGAIDGVVGPGTLAAMRGYAAR